MLLESCKIFLNVLTGMSYLLEAPLFDIPSCCNALWALVRASSVHLPRRSLHFWLRTMITQSGKKRFQSCLIFMQAALENNLHIDQATCVSLGTGIEVKLLARLNNIDVYQDLGIFVPPTWVICPFGHINPYGSICPMGIIPHEDVGVICPHLVILPLCWAYCPIWMGVLYPPPSPYYPESNFCFNSLTTSFAFRMKP